MVIFHSYVSLPEGSQVPHNMEHLEHVSQKFTTKKTSEFNSFQIFFELTFCHHDRGHSI